MDLCSLNIFYSLIERVAHTHAQLLPHGLNKAKKVLYICASCPYHYRMTKSVPTYPLTAARALALHTQQLDAPIANSTPGTDAIYDTVDRIGWVQLDTLQMVRRSQYVALWSRLGPYDTADFDRLTFGSGDIHGANDRRLFEYWMHAACIIPLSLYRFTIPMMRHHKYRQGKRRREWLEDPANIKVLDAVLERVRENGLVRSADFERTDGRRGTWWDWKPAKIALEHLYNTGELTIANRVNFQRIYGITETVLPDWVDTTPPTEEEAYLTLLDKSARALGICAPMQIPDYFHMKRTPAKPLIQRMLDEGTLVPVNVKLEDGAVAEQVIHRANLPLLQRAADGDIEPNRTTFLSPFDSLFWAKGRDMQFWGFQQILEAYKPAPQRIWGYFCLPILHNDRLVGRFDPKLERKESTLRLKHLHLEPGVLPEDDLVADIAGAMRSFMAFHDATDLVIEQSKPRGLRRKLLKAM